MIYSPSKFVFIHIPRTGGMAITQALASRLPEIADMTINVSGLGDQRWWRHSRACELARDIPHWEKLYRFSALLSPLSTRFTPATQIHSNTGTLAPFRPKNCSFDCIAGPVHSPPDTLAHTKPPLTPTRFSCPPSSCLPLFASSASPCGHASKKSPTLESCTLAVFAAKNCT